MSNRVLKAIGIGLLAGTAIYFAPFFLVRVLIFFLIIGLIFRLFGWRRRWYRGYGFWHNPAYARRWHSMTDEERKAFMEKMEKELFNKQDPTVTNL